MWERFEIGGKTCRILRHGAGGPLFLWAFYPHEGHELEKMESAAEGSIPDQEYTIAAWQTENWNRDLSPWKAPAVMGDKPFEGKGQDTLRWVREEYQPWLRGHYPDCEKHYLMGYSLAGLFALWSLYETDGFNGAVCCSGSLWIGGWDRYVSERGVMAPADVYLSLGGREEKTKNPVMARVGECTRKQESLLRQDPMVRRCVLEWNAGGHFADSAGRLVKGMAWIGGPRRQGTI